MGFRKKLGRWRRREAKVEAAARVFLGVDPYRPCPVGFDVAVALEGFPGHMHYGTYTETLGAWPNIRFTTWYDCAVCGRLS